MSSDSVYVSIQRDPVSNRLIVLLNSAAWTNCSYDDECPGTSLCYINTSWSAFPKQCACNVPEHLWGRECSERWSNPLGKFLLAAWSTTIGLYAIVVVASFATLYLIMRYEGIGKIRRSPAAALNTALVLLAATLGVVRTAIYVSPLDIERSPRTHTITFRSAISITALSALSIPYSFFLTLATLNVSVTWLKMASNVISLHASASRLRRFVFRYEVIRVSFYLLFLALTLAFALLNPTSRASRVLSNVFLIVILAYTLFTYWLGYVWIRRYVRGSLILANNEEMREHVSIISRAALAMSVLCFALVVFIACYLARLIDVTPTPLEDRALIVSQTISVLSILVHHILSWYLFASTRLARKWRTRRKRAAASVSGVFETVSCPTRIKTGGEDVVEEETNETATNNVRGEGSRRKGDLKACGISKTTSIGRGEFEAVKWKSLVG